MTEPDRPDPTILPMFAGSAQPRPGRVRSTFTINGHGRSEAPASAKVVSLVDATRVPAAFRSGPQSRASVDWAEVARLRTEASSQLT